jgi:hypothetical protein
MRPEERYELGTFSTFEEAVAACKRIVDDDLTEWAKRPSTAKDLYETYVCFGEDPFIVALDPNDKAPNFFSWDYAKERSQALAAQSNM